MFGETVSFAKLSLDIWKLIKTNKKSEVSIADRFIKLFEVHGVNRNQIPRFFDHGIKISNVQSSSALMDLLTDEILNDAANLFGIKRAWLDGATDEIYEISSVYKYPEKFNKEIEVLAAKGKCHGGRLLIGLSGKLPKHQGYDALICVEEEVGYLDDNAICRYHLYGDWIFNYWKSRAYLAACMAIAWKNKVYILGESCDRRWLAKAAEGTEFLDHEWVSSRKSIGEFRNPEYLALRPEVFLMGVDEGEFGRDSALGLWLELESHGWMDCGYDSARPLFEAAR